MTTYEPYIHPTLNLQMFHCLGCSSNRRDEECIRRQQRTCSQMGWNDGWCKERNAPQSEQKEAE